MDARPDPAPVVRSRAAALLLDAGLIAYAGWCVGFLVARATDGTSFLAHRPLLALAAVPLALLWQATDASLAQRAHRIERRGADGGPATLDRRALAGLLALLEIAALLVPVLLLGLSPAGLAASAGVAVLLATLAARDPLSRSPAERGAGVRTVVVPVPRTAPPSWWRRVNAWVVLALLALTFAVGGLITEVDVRELWVGAGHADPIFRALASPDTSIAGEVATLLVETIYIALLASTLALPFAFVLGFLAASNVTGATRLGAAVHALVRLLLNLTRSIEPVLWAIIFALWVGIGPFAGMLALCLHSVASLAKLYSEAIEGVDPGPVEALRSTGAPPLAVLRWGMLPQVVPALLSFTVYRWDINVRMATILGLVGGGGIGRLLLDSMQLSAWAKVGTIVLGITLVVWAMDHLSARVRRRVG
jgi:phosphonate transport system permease protein